MIPLIAVTLALLSIFSLAGLFRVRKRNPLFLFALFNSFFSLTTLSLLDLRSDADTAHVVTLLLTGFVVAVYPILFFNSPRYWRVEKKFNSNPSRAELKIKSSTIIILILSSIITIIYYEFLVGYNLLPVALAGGSDDFTTMRLASYAGDTYSGAGVVNQFKNTLLPIAFFSVFTIWWLRGPRFLCIGFLAIYFPFFLWAILGTGQRTFLFICLLAALYYFPVSNRTISKKFFIVGAAVVLFFFGLQSVSLGRVDNASLATVLDQLQHRIVNSNQRASAVGFRYVYEQDTVYGKEWLETLIGFIPGVPGSTLSNEVFAEMFGGFRGTAPVSLNTSIYHNFGMPLSPIIMLILLKIVERSHDILTLMPNTVEARFAYSFFSIYLAILPISNPFQIINNGLLGLILFFILHGIRVRRSQLRFKLR